RVYAQRIESIHACEARKTPRAPILPHFSGNNDRAESDKIAAMKLQAWDALESEQMNPDFRRKVIHGQNVTIARIELRKGAVVPEHSHINEQVSMVESGAIRFVSGGREQIVRAGECLTIPPNLP